MVASFRLLFEFLLAREGSHFFASQKKLKNSRLMGVAGMEKGSEGSFKWTYPAEGVAENRRFGARGRLSPHKKKCPAA